MDLGSTTPDPEVYPEGIHLDTEVYHDLNKNVDEVRWVATCGWCDRMGDHPFRHSSVSKTNVINAWQHHAEIYHPARLHPKFNARTVG